jgi:hypothetical protein
MAASSPQLLRNEAAGRIPVEFIEIVVHAEDLSKDCHAVERDPDGLIRSWNSSVRVSLTTDHGFKRGAIIDELAKCCGVHGWGRGTLGDPD